MRHISQDSEDIEHILLRHLDVYYPDVRHLNACAPNRPKLRFGAGEVVALRSSEYLYGARGSTACPTVQPADRRDLDDR